MKIVPDSVPEIPMPAFKGGPGVCHFRTIVQDGTKFLRGRLEPGSAIGMHIHEDSCETIIILEGIATVLKPVPEEGTELLKAVERAVKEKGGIRVVLHAQVRAKEFYEKQGYQPYGEIGFEEGCPHIWMYKIPSEEKD